MAIARFGLQTYLASRTHEYRLAVAPPAVALAESARAAAPGIDEDVAVLVHRVPDDAAARAAVADEDAWLHLVDHLLGDEERALAQ